MDKIRLDHMTFYGTHGVLSEENRLGQRFYVDLELRLDLKKATQSDDLHDSVNYAEVYEIVKKEVEQTQVNLIETLAENIAQRILSTFSIFEVWVRVVKPHPPIQGFQGAVSVELVRSRQQ